MRGQNSLAAILLVSHLAADGAKPLKASEFWALGDQLCFEEYPGALLGRTEEDLFHMGLAKDTAGRVVRLLDRATSMAFELERLDQMGIRTLTPFDDGYPSRLVDALRPEAPALLHTAGGLELLRNPGLGVVGSRNVTEEGAEIARDLGRRAARLGIPLVSGLARGVDQTAMNAAIEAEGAVIGIPAHSLTRTLKNPGVRRTIHEGGALICTPYAPGAPFSVWRAMGRNKLIYGLAEVTVVVAGDAGSGGTWGGAVEALKKLKKGYNQVAVWRGPGEGPGNELLEQKGARPITSIDEIEAVLSDPEPDMSERPRPEQGSLLGLSD